MKVSCQACGAKYTIADDKVRGRKVKIRCKSCGTPIVVDGQSEAPAAPAGGVAAVAVPTAAAGTPFGPSVITAPIESARLSGSGRGAGVDLFDANANLAAGASGPDE